MDKKWILRRREVTCEDIIVIRALIEKYFHKGRSYISGCLARHWQWYQSNGEPKAMACRYILLFLERQGFIKLPPPLRPSNNDNRSIQTLTLPEISLKGTVKDYPILRIDLLNTRREYKLWNRIVHSYHYQGYQLIAGKCLKYIVYNKDEPIACLGWGSAAWSLKGRDEWIGWSKEVKDKNLCKIVNNIRFLILPWVKIKYLASYLLGLSAKRVPLDWDNRYGHPIYLLETFVEKERFFGTCYKAANWIYLGETKGSAKRGSTHKYHGNIKRLFVYPLEKDFREKLIKD